MTAARLGLEPRLTGPEPVVLPLDDLAIFYKKLYTFSVHEPRCWKKNNYRLSLKESVRAGRDLVYNYFFQPKITNLYQNNQQSNPNPLLLSLIFLKPPL